MVLKERGKSGPVASSSSNSPSHFWLNVSVRNAENLSAKEVIQSTEFEEILAPLVQDVDRLSEVLDDSTTDNDSLPKTEDEKRFVGLSLNKKKRWLLPDLLKEQIREESLEEITDSPTVTLVERGLLDRGLQIENKADCRAVYTTGSRSGQCEKHAKRRYAHLTDLRNESELDDVVLEICYEVGHPFQNRVKNREHLKKKRVKTQTRIPKRESKGRVIAEEIGYGLDDMCQDFEAHEFDNTVDERLGKTPVNFSLNYFLHNKDKPPNKTRNTDSWIKPKKYGKGEAIVIPKPEDFVGIEKEEQRTPPVVNPAPNTDDTPRICPDTTYTPVPESVMYINVEQDSISTGRLLDEFEGSIEFRHTVPEKCMINLLPHLNVPRIEDYDLTALMLFELPQEFVEDMDVVEIKATIELRTESGPLVAVTKSVHYHVKQLCTAPIPLRDLVGHIASFLSKKLAFKELRKPEKVQNLTLPLSTVQGLCGVEVQGMEFHEALRELADKGCTTDCKHCTAQPTGKEWTGECGICFTEGADMGFTCLKECGHWFCDSCWKQHIDTQMGQMQINITCPAFKCTATVNDSFVFSVAPHVYPRYKLLKNQALVTRSKEHHFCPGKDCGRVAVVRETGVKPMSTVPFACPCSKVWCTDCREMAHWPVSCKVASEFRVQLGKSGMNLFEENYMLLNRIESVQVKKCPKCKYPIEKHQGCPHMHCTLCDYHFCWQCLGRIYSSEHTTARCIQMTHDAKEVKLTVFHGSKLLEQHADTVLMYRSKWAKKTAMYKPYKNLSYLKKLTSTLVKFKKVKFSIADSYYDYQSLKDLEEILGKGLDFKYQAYFVLENVAMIFSMFPKKQRKRMKHLFDTLEFTVQVIDQVLKRTKLLKDPQVSKHLTRMISGGETLFGKLKVNKVQ